LGIGATFLVTGFGCSRKAKRVRKWHRWSSIPKARGRYSTILLPDFCCGSWAIWSTWSCWLAPSS
jgi:hypothetical protein